MAKYEKLKELSILYVEDEQDVIDEITDILSVKVKTLYTACNGQEALDIFNSNDIDIIVTDIQMPIMDGMTFITKVREINSEIPIVITTAYNEVNFLKQSINLHVDKYITKPIDIMQLLEVLNRAAKVVLQNKEIQKQNIIIKTLLDMRPYYSVLVDENNMDSFINNFDKTLGVDCGDSICSYDSKTGDCDTYSDIKELVSHIASKKCDVSRSECKNIVVQQGDKKYILKPYFFEGIHIFMLSFFEYDKVKTTYELDKCLTCLSLSTEYKA